MSPTSEIWCLHAYMYVKAEDALIRRQAGLCAGICKGFTSTSCGHDGIVKVKSEAKMIRVRIHISHGKTCKIVTADQG